MIFCNADKSDKISIWLIEKSNTSHYFEKYKVRIFSLNMIESILNTNLFFFKYNMKIQCKNLNKYYHYDSISMII